MKPYVLVWSKGVRPVVMALSRPKMLELRAHCYALIWLAEFYRANAHLLVRIGKVDLQEKDLPFAPFRRHGHTFRLQCTRNEYYGQREYALVFADEPPPSGPVLGGKKAAPAAAPKSRKGKQAPRGEARPARVRKPRKTSKRKLLISYNSYNKNIRRYIRSQISPRLARILDWTRESAENLRRRGLEGAKNLSVCLPRVNAAARRIRASLEAPSLGAHTPVSRNGRYETRAFGHNLGMCLSLSTIVFEEPPIDWSADLFGIPDHQGEQATA
jgi:hypothetical protein